MVGDHNEVVPTQHPTDINTNVSRCAQISNNFNFDTLYADLFKLCPIKVKLFWRSKTNKI